MNNAAPPVSGWCQHKSHPHLRTSPGGPGAPTQPEVRKLTDLLKKFFTGLIQTNINLAIAAE